MCSAHHWLSPVTQTHLAAGNNLAARKHRIVANYKVRLVDLSFENPLFIGQKAQLGILLAATAANKRSVIVLTFI